MCICCKDYKSNYPNYNFCPMCGESFNKNCFISNKIIITQTANPFTPTMISHNNNVTGYNTGYPVRRFLK